MCMSFSTSFMSGVKKSNRERNYYSLEEIPASSLQPKLLLWDSYEIPRIAQGGCTVGSFREGYQPSVTPVQPVQTENSRAEAQGSCCILWELSLPFIVAQVRIEPARRTYYHGSTSHRLILFSELLAVWYRWGGTCIWVTLLRGDTYLNNPCEGEHLPG